LDHVSEYIATLFAAEDPLLSSLREEADRTGLPPAAISADTGRLLQVLMRAVGARRVLEVGTLGGYSAIWIARALPEGGRLITIERDERHAAFAARYLDRAGVGSVVTLRRGRALDVLPSLDGEEFDLIFLDADRAPLPTYLDWALRLVRGGGMIVAHHALCGGRVVVSRSPTDDDEVRGAREFNQRIATDSRVSSILIPAYDGLVVAVVDASR
jgi:predicted O-methyltransferase YrrM